ncbi:MAG: IS66 family transposase [Planctomycetaceae bacterium]|nr:IS66 family transposase [Planctomycetaceae bacterium]
MIPPLSKPPIPEPLWDTVPPQAQAALLALLNSLYQRIAELERRLNQNSTNSSKPPSSDPIGLKRKPPAPPSGRSRGAQPGHPKAFRTLVPPEKLRSCRDCKPRSCRRCGHDLHGEDPTPLIHQVADLPKIEPVVDQYRLHRLTCPDCGVTTCGTLPDGVPTRSFGPSLQAVLATLAGAYRLSKRQIQQLAADLFGLSISTGMISKLEQQSALALAAPYQELADAVHQAEVVNIDETGWRENRRKAWLWVTVTAMATVFTIAASRSGQVARTVLGDKEDQVVGSDRFSACNWIWAFWRQICWSHLRRDFQAMIDRGGEAGVIGRRLMRLSDRVFGFWHRARDGTLEYDCMRESILRLRPAVRRALEDGTVCRCAMTAGTCAEILRVEEGLWNFVWFPGVEPTNNAAERAVRHAVIWRRISGGTDSQAGSRFVERMLTVVATCRQQGRNVLDYLSSCFQAARNGQAIPSLLPVAQAEIKAA